MNSNSIKARLLQSKEKNEKSFSVLVDPDKANTTQLSRLAKAANKGLIDFFFVGGSLLTTQKLDDTINFLKDNTSIPVILFPGSTLQIHTKADAILFLSLISGRNADLLIGKHIEAAPILKNSNIQVIPTGYMIIDGGKSTSASYISNTQPIPFDKPEIAACTAMAGELLGLNCIYLEAGSGAINSVPAEMIRKVRESVNIPIIVGGGIRDKETAKVICEAGADVIVVGTKIETDFTAIEEIFLTIKNTETKVCN